MSLAEQDGKRYFGLEGSARSWLIAELFQTHPKLLLVCSSRKIAEDLESDLRFFLGSEHVISFPDWDILPFDPVSPQTFISAQRIETLFRLNKDKKFLCLTSADTICQKLLPPSVIQRLRFFLHAGQQQDINRCKDLLLRAGYNEVSLVEEVGDMAVRGSVIDIFPSYIEQPVRLHFEDNLIESIKTFDPNTQRTSSDIQDVLILPVREYFTIEQNISKSIAAIKARGRELEVPPREIARFLKMVRAGETFPGMELFQPFVFSKMASFFEYLPMDTHIVIDDETGIKNNLDSFIERLIERENRFASESYLIPSRQSLYFEATEALADIANYSCDYIDQVHMEDGTEDSNAIHITSLSNTELSTKLKTKVGSGNALEPLYDSINRWRKSKFRIAFVVGSPIRAERLKRYLLDLDMDAQLTGQNGISWLHAPRPYPLVILQGYLTEGFRIPKEKIAFIAENEVFAERSYRRNIKQRASLRKLLSTLSNLQEDDYVVHTDYGIGIYKGLKQLTVDDVIGDFLQIDYADSRLYLPIQNIGRIQKFVASEGQVPTLDKLGNHQRWIKTKQKVRDSVVTLAGDLIKLYAARSVAKGWRFDVMGSEDERFADYFPYDETPDQLKAVEETLENMAQEKIMDRLVCGDVGFGKTEVALRAAFKATQHARQVAILVPTTILAEQHYQTFLDRFRDYPVKTGVISRFYDTKANKATIEQLANGEIDIIIGTHRLLQRDVQFHDLGLLIIDEEHRFGVAQKERLKSFKKNVDVLTLTATPIPRTLHMSLLGIRDISIISTPPVDRRAIRTYVASYDENLVRDAIFRELQRGGQCFFVHNRVQSILPVMAELKLLVPEARYGIAHGQMSEKELEPLMHKFLNKEIDVLVCTSIIESGLDIPNVNTIILDRADIFGLAQLYQLRGRVGRSERQAYAYFLIPKSRKLGLEAQQRLKALQSLDDLGLGFNLAIRDLEIRGAGNLLGREQSGNVLSVGYELYSRILKEAVLNVKGEELSLEESIDPEVKVQTSAFIPEHYIPDISERLVLYQRLASIESSDDAYDMAREIEDRFGPLHEPVENLIEIMRYRSLLKKCGIIRAEQSSLKLTLYFTPKASVDPQKIIKLSTDYPDEFKLGKNLSLSIFLKDHNQPSLSQLYERTERVMDVIRS